MQPVNAPLTIWTQHLEDRVGRLLSQARAIPARAVRFAHDFAAMLKRAARAVVSRASKMYDAVERIVLERVAADKLAMRRIFLLDPKNPGKGYTKDGFILLRFLAQQANTYAPTTALDPIQMAVQHGQKLQWARIMDAICTDMHDFALLLAEEEKRRNEEIVPA